jgi:putative transposase
MWVEPDVRDEIIDYAEHIANYSKHSIRYMIMLLGIGSSRFYDWKKRTGMENRHNGLIPRTHWILPEEIEAIIKFCRDKLQDGYRRLTYMMIDQDIAYVSPATTYRILKRENLLNRWIKPLKTNKGNGFVQPLQVHRDWHTDIAYVNILGTIFFLISVLDGFSRKILHHELRENMRELDVEIVIQRTLEQYPDARPNVITDNGSQYISKDFKEFIRESGLTHIRTSVRYPQSNGKIERFHKTIKEEKIRTSSLLGIEDAKRQVAKYVDYYNEVRLHSAIFYLTPQEVFEGKMEERLAERQRKLDTARKKRTEIAIKRLSA